MFICFVRRAVGYQDTDKNCLFLVHYHWKGTQASHIPNPWTICLSHAVSFLFTKSMSQVEQQVGDREKKHE